MRLWIGAIPADDSALDAGVYAVDVEAGGGLGTARLVAGALRPAFLAVHPFLRVIYAVDEEGPGRVTSLREGRDRTLQTIGVEPTGGDGACHLDVHPSGRLLAVAHYWSACVTFHPIAEDGAAGHPSCVVRYSGSGPDLDRQSESHPHCVRFTANGSLCVVADLGTDTVSVHRVQLEGYRVEESFAAAAAAPGAGPRHIAFTPPDVIHVSCELDATVTTFRLHERDGALTRRSRVAASAAPSSERNFPSEIAHLPGTGFVYVANRGADLVTAFEVAGDRGLTPLGATPSGGRWPRHLAVADGHLYCANERSNEIVHFRVDGQTGRLADSGSRASVPSPTCIAIERRAQTAAATPPSPR